MKRAATVRECGRVATGTPLPDGRVALDAVALGVVPELPDGGLNGTPWEASEAAALSLSGLDDRLRLPSEPFLALVADSVALDPPARVEEFSSHRLLWETIRRELQDDPLAVGTDPDAYLSRRLQKYAVRAEGLDRPLFCEGLIAPAYAQGLAGLLLRGGLPLLIFGTGWDVLPELAPHARGAVEDRAMLHSICTAASAVIAHRPYWQAHPIDAIGKPIVRPLTSDPNRFIRSAREALAGNMHRPVARPSLAAESILRLVNPNPRP